MINDTASKRKDEKQGGMERFFDSKKIVKQQQHLKIQPLKQFSVEYSRFHLY